MRWDIVEKQEILVILRIQSFKFQFLQQRGKNHSSKWKELRRKNIKNAEGIKYEQEEPNPGFLKEKKVDRDKNKRQGVGSLRPFPTPNNSEIFKIKKNSILLWGEKWKRKKNSGNFSFLYRCPDLCACFTWFYWNKNCFGIGFTLRPKPSSTYFLFCAVGFCSSLNHRWEKSLVVFLADPGDAEGWMDELCFLFSHV